MKEKINEEADAFFDKNKGAAKGNHDKACDLYRNYVSKAKTDKERLRRINRFRCG